MILAGLLGLDSSAIRRMLVGRALTWRARSCPGCRHTGRAGTFDPDRVGMGRIWASGPYPLRPGWPLRFWPAPTVRSGLPGQEGHPASSRYEGGPVKRPPSDFRHHVSLSPDLRLA